MFKNVLVGVDGSTNGRDAIALAFRLAESGAKLTFAHVRPGELHPLHAMTPGLLVQEREASEKLLEGERSDAGVEAELVSVVASSPGGGLHSHAEQVGADLIVVGSCGRGAFGRAMLGDDTRAALNGSPCAVAIADRGYAEHPTPIAKVGVGYNDSPESKAALAVAKHVAEATRASVEALEVVSIPTYAYTGLMPPTIGEGIDVMLAEARARLSQLPDVQGRAVYGLTGEELAAFSDEVDILVVGSRSYGPVRRLVLGSTSDFLERHARCSLLVLPRAVTTAQEGSSSTEGEHSQLHVGSPA
jgi:nucleotide-binding universal stress UspA family protein